MNSKQLADLATVIVTALNAQPQKIQGRMHFPSDEELRVHCFGLASNLATMSLRANKVTGVTAIAPSREAIQREAEEIMKWVKQK